MIDLVIKAKDRPGQIAAVRALDRVLLWGFYVIPHFHAPFWRVAYWDKIAMLKNPPYGFSPYLWWDKNLERKP
ncbi:Oligopeptide ABC transporter, periplasmic oligopeptide-binding protein OppA (TC 3.A.1.5.1) [Helicobacter heilmannii ASB1.4]|nr:Oligopeptide ABC transporter, periplasmic oligopeptide-binding protein OppA (TC 3.A.1.5.1) [Helicobacter heilmannii ASB1.4]